MSKEQYGVCMNVHYYDTNKYVVLSLLNSSLINHARNDKNMSTRDRTIESDKYSSHNIF